MKMFQKEYSSKRGVLFTIAYSLVMAAGIAAIVFNPTNVVLYIAVACCLFGLVFHLTAKKRVRKSIIKTLSKMNPEEYCCTIYKKRIEIETIIKPKEEVSGNNDDNKNNDNNENKENPENSDMQEEELKEPTPIKSVFKFKDDLLNFSEDKLSLYLVYNRQQIYCFPKRCLSEEVQEKVSSYLKEMTGEEII